MPLLALMVGCEKQESVSTYSVPKYESLQTSEFLKQRDQNASKPARMLGAIVPHESSLWFFKLQGGPDDVAARVSDVKSFLQTVRFAEGSKIAWSLPDTWKQLPGDSNRYATLVLSSDPKLEMSVTVLSAGGVSPTEALLNNINRWRGQLDLPHIDAEDLPSRTETLKSGDSTITLINILGKAAPRPAMPPGMMPGQGAGVMGREGAPEKEGSKSKETANPPDSSRPAVPEGWSEEAPKQFQIARYVIKGESDQNAEVALSVVGGGLAANLNRWRGQLELPPFDDAELKAVAKPFEIGSRKGELYEFAAKDRSILGIIIPEGDRHLFIKFTGPTALAVKERARFEAFAKSLDLD